MIDRRLGLPFSIPNGIAMNTIDEEMVELMKEAGCYEVYLPFESGNPRVLRDVMKKTWVTGDKALEVADLFRRHGIRTMAYFMMGLPGETLEEMEDTYRMAVRSKVFMPIIFAALVKLEVVWESLPISSSMLTVLPSRRGVTPCTSTMRGVIVSV